MGKSTTLIFSFLFPLLCPAQNTLIIKNVAIVDVKTSNIEKNRTVVIQGNKIASISTKTPAQKNATTVDGVGKYLIPGLWDMHAHFLGRWDRSAPLYVATGVTGVRDMANPMPLSDARDLKKKVLEKRVLGPRFITAGRLLDGPVSRFPNVAILIPNKERAETIADSLKQEGIDFYKVYETLPRDAFYAIIQKGKEHHLAVSGHVPSSVTGEEAMKAGMKSIEHFKFVLQRNNNPGDSNSVSRLFQLAMWDLSKNDTVAAEQKNKKAIALIPQLFSDSAVLERGKLLAKNNTWIVPTMVQSLTGNYGKQNMRKELHWEFMPPSVTIGWRNRVANDKLFMRGDTSAYTQYELRTVGGLHKAGVKFLAGTDANDAFIGNIPGFSVHEEMQLFVKAGLSNLEALQTATLNPAIFLEATDSLGTIEENKIADLVLLQANPLETISNTTKIYGVILNGRYLDRKKLDELLEQVKSLVKSK